MKTNYNYTKMAIVIAALAVLIDWFVNDTFGFIGISLAVIPMVFIGEMYRNSKLENK